LTLLECGQFYIRNNHEYKKTLGFDIGFFSMPTRSIASATYTTSSSIPTGSITAIATIANSNSNTLS
jgi:hypothetical protein